MRAAIVPFTVALGAAIGGGHMVAVVGGLLDAGGDGVRVRGRDRALFNLAPRPTDA